MKTLHTVLLSTMLVAVLALAVGAFQPWGLAAEALHGSAQHESLTEPFHAAFAAMQELHRLHDVIAAELTESQQHHLARMTHEMMCGGMSEREHDEEHREGPRQ